MDSSSNSIPNANMEMLKSSLVSYFGEEKASEIAIDTQAFLNFLVGWRNIRPWGEFFAGFKLPQADCDLLKQRLATNLLHYRSNYLILCVGIFSVRSVLSTTM